MEDKTLCKVCGKNKATGPKIIPEASIPGKVRTLLMCDECYEQYKRDGVLPPKQTKE